MSPHTDPMFNPLRLIPRRSHRRWFYGLLSAVVALGVAVGSPAPTGAISIQDLIRGGIQVIQGVQLSNMSADQEVQFGKEINQQLVTKEIRLYRDPALNRYINQIGQRLAQNSSRSNIPYTFQVVRDDAINAFATVGGFVYVNTGLIKAADNEAQLASVMAHEIGHIEGKHVLKGIRKAAIEQGIASAAGIDRNTAVQLGVQLAFRLPRSRQYEYEADEKGLDMLGKAGYDPSGMIAFFEKLMEKRGGPAPTFLSTHPATEDRIQAIKEKINATPRNAGSGLDSSAYRARIQPL